MATFTKKNFQQYIDSILVKIYAAIKAKGRNTKY